MSTVENEAVRNETNRGETIQSDLAKVVIHLDTGIVKGFIENPPVDSLEAPHPGASPTLPNHVRIRRLGLETMEVIPTEQTRAIFYVKDFNGDPKRKDLHFYKRAPFVHGVWLRVEFLTGEIMEGLVYNAKSFVVDPGFFLRPTDPNSNNILVYIFKGWMKDCRILGLRKI